MDIAPEPPGDPRGVGGGSSSFRNHWTQGLTYPYVRISSEGFLLILWHYEITMFYCLTTTNYLGELEITAATDDESNYGKVNQ